MKNLAFLFLSLSISSLVFSSCKEQTKEADVLKVESSLEIFDIDSNSRTTIYKETSLFEAPNWSRDGEFLVFNGRGNLFTIPVVGGLPSLLNTGIAIKCNNDHGISPDNTTLVVSHHEEKSGKSMIYTLPISGGEPTLITPNAPSYWHGWSPDGKTLAYCAERNEAYDI